MLRNGTWAIMGPRCLMNCELVRSQFIAQILTPVWGLVWDPLVVSMGQFFFPLHSGFLCLRMWRVWGTTNFAAHLLVNKLRTYRGKTLYIKSPGETQKKSWTRGPNIHNQNLLCSAFSTNKILNNMYRIAYWVMWDRAPYLVNIEVRGAPRQILGKTWLSHIAAPSASLHSIGTENRPFAGICRRFFFKCLLSLKRSLVKDLPKHVFWLLWVY